MSKKKRKFIKETFGWSKVIGSAARTMLRERGTALLTLNITTENILMLVRLLAAHTGGKGREETEKITPSR